MSTPALALLIFFVAIIAILVGIGIYKTIRRQVQDPSKSVIESVELRSYAPAKMIMTVGLNAPPGVTYVATLEPLGPAFSAEPSTEADRERKLTGLTGGRQSLVLEFRVKPGTVYRCTFVLLLSETGEEQSPDRPSATVEIQKYQTEYSF